MTQYQSAVCVANPDVEADLEAEAVKYVIRLPANRLLQESIGHLDAPVGRPPNTVRRSCEQWIREDKGAINWTRLSCRSFAADTARFQLHALA